MRTCTTIWSPATSPWPTDVYKRQVVGNYYIAQQDDPTMFTVLPEVLEAEEYGIAFRKGEQTLADAVSQQLIDMANDGTLDTIRAKWFANDITLVAKYAQ